MVQNTNLWSLFDVHTKKKNNLQVQNPKSIKKWCPISSQEALGTTSLNILLFMTIFQAILGSGRQPFCAKVDEDHPRLAKNKPGHKPAMTENGKHIAPIKMLMGDCWWPYFSPCFTHTSSIPPTSSLKRQLEVIGKIRNSPHETRQESVCPWPGTLCSKPPWYRRLQRPPLLETNHGELRRAKWRGL